VGVDLRPIGRGRHRPGAAGLEGPAAVVGAACDDEREARRADSANDRTAERVPVAILAGYAILAPDRLVRAADKNHCRVRLGRVRLGIYQAQEPDEAQPSVVRRRIHRRSSRANTVWTPAWSTWRAAP